MLKRICRGWYALPQADERVVRAILAGGRLGCLSGCRFYGIWVPHHTSLHVVYGAGKRPRPLPGICSHPWDGPVTRKPIWSVAECVQQVIHRHDAETGLIVMESAMNLELLRPSGLPDLLAGLPAEQRQIVRFLDVAESGSETRIRLFLRRLRVPVRPQVAIPGIGHVDLLVGDKLIIECDSDEYHRSKEQHRIDRQRDLAALELGYDKIRLTYHQIWMDWEATQNSLRHQLRRRRHLNR